MPNLLAWMVVLLLVGPPLVFAIGAVLILVAAILPSAPRRLRETFCCPWAGRVVTADFLVPEGAPHPTEVVSCTAFRDPKRVRCGSACRAIADVQWGVSRGVFPRWALTAGGPVTWRSEAVEAARTS